tara:strand:- start:1161 stop:1388 length:228 start_codon:yes stop_codon:yes gene_type:complete
MKVSKQLLMEAIAVGIVVVALGYLIVYVMSLMKLKMNKEKQMVLGFFMLGFITHIVCEFTGINKWYCKKGHACLK